MLPGMQLIDLPSTTLRASQICLGTAEWDSLITGDDVPRLLELYLQQGGNLLDSAHCYAAWLDNGKGEGRSERAVGRAVRQLGVRNQVIIATKGGHPTINEHYRRPAQTLSRQIVENDVAQSLERLGMETIDLYYLHRDDGITSIPEIMEMMNDLVKRKQIRYFASSNWSTRRMQEANDYAASKKLQGFCCSQVCWALATPTWKIADREPTTRYPLDADRQWHTRTAMPIVCYSSTARGYFATEGAVKGGYDTPENAARLARVQELVKKLNKTPNQVALAWLMNQPFPVIPITGTVKPEHLHDTLGAAGLTLTPRQIHWLEKGN